MNQFEEFLKNILKASSELIRSSELYTGHLFALDRGWVDVVEAEYYKNLYRQAKDNFQKLWKDLQINYRKEFLSSIELLDKASPKIKSKLSHSDYTDFREALAILKKKSYKYTVQWAVNKVFSIYFVYKKDLSEDL